jgi:hypothetical protein
MKAIGSDSFAHLNFLTLVTAESGIRTPWKKRIVLFELLNDLFSDFI